MSKGKNKPNNKPSIPTGDNAVALKPKWQHIILIVLLGSIVFFNSLQGELHYDDYHVMNEINTTINVNNLRLVTWFTFYVNSLFGESSLVLNHIVNLIIHIIISICIYLIVVFAIEKKESLVPLATSILFLVHPLTTEPVNYITARFTQMYTLFCFLTLLWYVLYTRTRRKIYAVICLISFIMGVFSKGVGIYYMMAGISIYSIYYLNWKKIVFNNKYKWLIFTSMLFIIFFMLTNTGLVSRLNRPFIAEYFLMENKVFLFKYIQLLLIPIGQSVNHCLEPLHEFSFDLTILASIIINLALIVYSIVIRKRNKIVSFSILWIYIMHFPYFLLASSNELVVEYRAYPMIFGYALLVSYLINRYLNKKALQNAVILFIAVIYTVLTISRNNTWRDEITLWTDTLKKYPENIAALNSRGIAYKDKGLYDKAIEDYNEAIKLKPRNSKSYINRGTAFAKTGIYDKAILDFKKAIEINPKSIIAKSNLERVYRIIKSDSNKTTNEEKTLKIPIERLISLIEKGALADALAHCNRLIETNPNVSELYNKRGVICAMKANYEEAITSFTRSIELDPLNAEAYNNRSQAYKLTGKPGPAKRDKEKAKTLIQALDDRP